jgi:CBS domain-containing protein
MNLELGLRATSTRSRRHRLLNGEPAFGAEQDLASDDGLNTGVFRCEIEINGAEKVVCVGNGNRRHAELFRPLHERLDTDCPLQKAVLGVNMKVYKPWIRRGFHVCIISQHPSRKPVAKPKMSPPETGLAGHTYCSFCSDREGPSLTEEQTMKVKNFATSDVETIEAQETVLQAARLMREAHVGCLVVVERAEDELLPVGILTDRDIVVEAVAHHLPVETTTVQDIMSEDLVTCFEDDHIDHAVELMRSNGIRRLPIVSEEHSLRGILSLDDVLEKDQKDMPALVDVPRTQRNWEREIRG